MRPITKISLAIVALIGILQAGLVATLVWPLNPLAAWLTVSRPALRWSLLGLSAVVLATFVVMLLVAVLRQATTTKLIVKSPQGQLVLSRQAVANTIAQAIVSDHAVKNVNVDVQLLKHRQTVKVFVEATSLQGSDLTTVGKQIEATARKKVTQTLKLTAKSVQVSLHPATSVL